MKNVISLLLWLRAMTLLWKLKKSAQIQNFPHATSSNRDVSHKQVMRTSRCDISASAYAVMHAHSIRQILSSKPQSTDTHVNDVAAEREASSTVVHPWGAIEKFSSMQIAYSPHKVQHCCKDLFLSLSQIAFFGSGSVSISKPEFRVANEPSSSDIFSYIWFDVVWFFKINT